MLSRAQPLNDHPIVVVEAVSYADEVCLDEPTRQLSMFDERPIPPVPARKRDVPSSFSAVQDLMPGKKPEREKAPGWVAA